jgi:hypothetical protein
MVNCGSGAFRLQSDIIEEGEIPALNRQAGLGSSWLVGFPFQFS